LISFFYPAFGVEITLAATVNYDGYLAYKQTSLKVCHFSGATNLKLRGPV
jgi:hypothetical protein